MGYTLEAMVGRSHRFTPVPEWIADSVVIPLRWDIRLLPMTFALLDALPPAAEAEGAPPGEGWGFRFMDASVVAVCKDLSSSGPVAYVEADFFGGFGEQPVMVWREGQLILASKLDGIGPINEALRLLGVRRSETSDEFAAVGLGRFRSTEDRLTG